MKYYCAMDVGGTLARLKIEDQDGKLLGEFKGKGCTLNVDGNDLAEQRYRDIVLSSLDELKLKPENCAGVCVAASGVDTKQNESDCVNFFVNMGFDRNVIKACNDCEVFLLSSDEPDMIIISGTGSISIGRDGDGFVRCGGWGHIISDEGSAYAMAVKIFRAVSRHLDERESCPILKELLFNELGFTSPIDLNEYLTDNALTRTNVACFAKLAEQAAQQGDEGAQRILEECVDELYGLITDTKKKLKKESDKNFIVWFWGSVIDSPQKPIAKMLEKRVTQDEHMYVKFPNCNAIEAAMVAARKNS